MASLFCNFLPLSLPPRKSQTLLPFPSSPSSLHLPSFFVSVKNGLITVPKSNSSYGYVAQISPSLPYANTLFFKSGYNVQVVVDENEPEEKLVGRFRREVLRAGVIQESKRRRYFENKQEEKKRKTREAAKREAARNRRRRPQSRMPYDKQEEPKNKKDDDQDDNWELPEGELP